MVRFPKEEPLPDWNEPRHCLKEFFNSVRPREGGPEICGGQEKQWIFNPEAKATETAIFGIYNAYKAIHDPPKYMGYQSSRMQARKWRE